MTALLEGAKKLVARGSDLGARIEGLDAAADAARGRLDDAVVDDVRAAADRAVRPDPAVRRPHRRGDRRRDRLRQVVHLQLADRARPVGRRRTPAHDVVGDRLRVGERGRERAARVARHPRPAPGHARLDARHPSRGPEPRGRRPARPSRPRLDRALPPPRGGPAGPARRPAGVGPRPAEVRRCRDPRPLPRAVHHPPGRDPGRAQPDRHRARGATGTRWSPTYAACSTRKGSAGCR